MAKEDETIDSYTIIGSLLLLAFVGMMFFLMYNILQEDFDYSRACRLVYGDFSYNIKEIELFSAEKQCWMYTRGSPTVDGNNVNLNTEDDYVYVGNVILEKGAE